MSDGDRYDEGSCRLTPEDVAIEILGRCLLPSPVAGHLAERAVHFVGAADKVVLNDSLSGLRGAAADLAARAAFELAGPRDKIFFDPRTVRCGIVTCGGLAPGLNNVVRGIVLELWAGYGVRQIFGFRFVHVPMPLAIRGSRRVDTDGDLWMSVIEATGQPRVYA